MLSLNVLPAVWGGPWQWTPVELPNGWSAVVANPSPAEWMSWVCLLATAVAVGLILRGRPCLRPWLLGSIGFSALVIIAASVARAGNPFASEAYRYTFDLVWPLGLLMVLSVVPLWWEGSRTSRWGGVLVVLVCVSAVFSSVVPARLWIANESRVYMANATRGFDLIPPDATVLAQGVPSGLVDPIGVSPFANTAAVMSPVPGAPSFGDVSEGRLLGFGPMGLVEEQTIQGPASVAGPDGRCGYQVTSVPRSIPLDGELISWAFYARVSYVSATDTTLNLAVGGQINSVPLRAGGQREVYFPVQGPGKDVLVSLGSESTIACLNEIRIGNRVSLGSGDVVPIPPKGLSNGE